MAKWAKEYPVAVLCRVLAVTKSAYYDWKQRGTTVISAEEFMLCARMQARFVQSCDSLSKCHSSLAPLPFLLGSVPLFIF